MRCKAQIGEITLQFNPEEIRQRKEVKYTEIPIKGMDIAPIDFKGGSGKRKDLVVFLDGPYAGKNSIEDQIEILEGYADKDSETDAPPILDFIYGSRMETVVVEAVETVDKFLDPDDASRTRAMIILSLREYKMHEFHRTPREQKGDRIFITGAKSTWRSIAISVYNNGELDQAIIDYNPEILILMEGPLLPSGKEIRIPSWEIAEAYLSSETTGGLIRYA